MKLSAKSIATTVSKTPGTALFEQLLVYHSSPQLFTNPQSFKTVSHTSFIMSQQESIEGTRRTSTRNPRRRQRPASERDSLPSQPRRKRSKLSKDTFDTPEETVGTSKQNGSAVMNGHATAYTNATRRQSSIQPENTIEVVVRGAKKTTAKRATKSDGSTVLVCIRAAMSHAWTWTRS